MALYRVALFGQKYAVEQFTNIVPPHPLLAIDNLSYGGPETFRVAARTYHFTVLMYHDQDPDAVLWVQHQIKLHRQWQGVSLIILAPVVEEYHGGHPTILQQAPVVLDTPDHAFQLLKLIATSLQPRVVTPAGPVSPLPVLPGAARSRPVTPRPPRQHRSRPNMDDEHPAEHTTPLPLTKTTAHQWRDLQASLKNNAESTNRLACNLAFALLMLLDAGSVARVCSGDLRAEIRSRVFYKQVTDQGLLDFLHYLAGLPAEVSRSILVTVTQVNVRQLLGSFMDEDMLGSRWTAVVPATIQDVISQHFAPLTSEEILNSMQFLSKWPGMSHYFYLLWSQSTSRNANAVDGRAGEKSGIYSKRHFWHWHHSWTFHRRRHDHQWANSPLCICFLHDYARTVTENTQVRQKASKTHFYYDEVESAASEETPV